MWGLLRITGRCWGGVICQVYEERGTPCCVAGKPHHRCAHLWHHQRLRRDFRQRKFSGSSTGRAGQRHGGVVKCAARAGPPRVMHLQSVHLSVALRAPEHLLLCGMLQQNSRGDGRRWGFGGSRWKAVGSGSDGGCGGRVGGRRGSEAADRAGSRTLWVVECAAGTCPALLLSAAQPQDLVEVWFLARRLTDGAARSGAGVQEGAAST